MHFGVLCVAESYFQLLSLGISMTLLESKDGLQHFAFVHNRDYQQVQFKFLDAVESMDPNNIVVGVANTGWVWLTWGGCGLHGVGELWRWLVLWGGRGYGLAPVLVLCVCCSSSGSPAG